MLMNDRGLENGDSSDEGSVHSYDKTVDALIHLYRGEVQRVNTWRTRLDITPHWAIVMVAGVLTWTFADPSRTSALLILITVPMVAALLVLEARRHQMHEIWRTRLRFLEENFLAQMLDPDESTPREDWMRVLAEDLRVPRHKTSMVVSIGVRLRRIYFWLFLVLFFAWGLKLALHPNQAGTLQQVYSRASIGAVPGSGVVGGVIFLIVFLAGWCLFGRWLEHQERAGEIPGEEPGYEWRRGEEDPSDE